MSHIDRPWEGDVMKSTHRSTRHNRTLLACPLPSCMLLPAPHPLAQSTAATLRRHVSAAPAPPSGATVTAPNLPTALPRSGTNQARALSYPAAPPPAKSRAPPPRHPPLPPAPPPPPRAPPTRPPPVAPPSPPPTCPPG